MTTVVTPSRLASVEQLGRVGAPAGRGLDPLDEDDVTLEGRARRDEYPRGRPDDPALTLGQHRARAVDLEVVVVLRVQLEGHLGVPGAGQVSDGLGRGLAGVVPALEGGQQDGVTQGRHALDLDHLAALPSVGCRDPAYWVCRVGRRDAEGDRRRVCARSGVSVRSAGIPDGVR